MVVIGIVAVLVAAMLAYDYTRSYSTMANVAPSSLGGDNYLGRSATIILAGRVAREHRL